jgi:ATPase family associated with various cellular activities (AAA)
VSYYLKSGNTFRVSSKEQMDLHESLPVGNYVIKADPNIGFYLQQIEDFKKPAKLYGDVHKNTNRILTTFGQRNGGTGVLLCGEKGSGKSLLAKNVAMDAAKEGIPTLIINAPWHGDAFNSFIQNIEQPCVVLLDEYEKVYDPATQPAMLTLLDGVYPSKKLFLLTVNDKWRVDIHMRNRPGRIFYIIDYSGLDENFIREYCADNLKNKGEIDKLIQITHTFDQFNFDMLKALIEEMNRYGESVVDAIKFLNVRAEFASGVTYDVDVVINGAPLPKTKLHTPKIKGNPLSREFEVDYSYGADKDGDEIYNETTIQPHDLKTIDQNGQRYIFVTEDGVMVVLTKTVIAAYNYLDYM